MTEWNCHGCDTELRKRCRVMGYPWDRQLVHYYRGTTNESTAVAQQLVFALRGKSNSTTCIHIPKREVNANVWEEAI